MKEIQLTQGKVALVDDADFEFLSQWEWHYSRTSQGGYAARTAYKGGISYKIFMHKILLGCLELEGDHKDLNKLNNQKYNLRIATRLQNAKNKAVNKNNICGYRGVRKNNYTKKNNVNSGFIARIKRGKKSVHLGTFKTPEEAAKAYNEAAIQQYGEWACLNKI